MSAGEDFGGWTPAAGESPAEREKRLKREKRAAMLAASTTTAGAIDHAGTAPTASTSSSHAGAGNSTESFGGWQPAPGESPAEREKRMKREKRQAMLAAQNGAPQQQQHHGAPPAVPPPITSQRAEGESYGGWTPLAGESPADREKRIKREKRAAMLAASANASGHAVPSAYIPPPPELGGTGPSYAGSAVGQSEGAPGSEAGGDKKSKHAQSLTPARLRYLKRKKQTRKAKSKAAPKNKSNAAASATGDGEDSSAVLAGTKRQRAEDDEGDDDVDDDAESDGDASAAEAGVATAPKPSKQVKTADGAAAAGAKWPELSEAARQAKLELIAQKKAERREQRLAKKAELKRIKAEGGVVPPPKPRVVETTKRRTDVPETQVLAPPVEPESEQPTEPTEEEIEEQKRQEELAARKALKALKKQQRRQPRPEPDAVEEDTKMPDATPVLIPTAPESAADAEKGEQAVVEEAENAPAETAVLHRLPGATRPAPPSAKTLSALNVHEQVRDKQVVDPTTKVKITDEVGADGTSVSEKGRKRLRGDMGVQEWFAGTPRS